MYSNPLFRRSSLLLTALIISFGASACDIKFKVVETNKKAIYTSGETIIVECTVRLVHRNCTEELDALKFSSDGCKITGATKWAQVEPGVFTRKLKVQVSSATGTINARITCQRSCNKEGGYGKLSLPIKS